MKRLVICLLLASFLAPVLLFTGCQIADAVSDGDGADKTEDGNENAHPQGESVTEQIEAMFSAGITNNEQLKALRALVWQEYAEKVAKESPSRADELKKGKITYVTVNRQKMKVQTVVIGKKPADGYPLFLVYHGGGYDPSGQTNESQWSGMATRYTQTGVAGIYVSIRSVSDNESSGQIFSTDVSWKFYDRIIEDAILYLNADPNKVYIVGYSAGGNGVYQIAPAMPDRLAAATMTAGHPENVDLTSIYNLPFYLNAAELDSAYSRNTVTVEYAKKLDDLEKKYGGYEHYCFIHANKEHGVIGDNSASKQTVIKDIYAWLDAQKSGENYTGGTVSVTTDAATLMTAHTRDPLPTSIRWSVSTSRADVRGGDFYWLSTTGNTSTIIASYDKSTNTVTISKCDKRAAPQLTIYLNEDMLDVFSEVTVVLPSGKTKTYTPTISLETLRATTEGRGDPNYQFCASITITF